MTTGNALETLQQRVDAIEGGYEFLLAYAAQGLATDEGNANSEQLRTYLRRMDEGIAGLEPALREVIAAAGAVGRFRGLPRRARHRMPPPPGRRCASSSHARASARSWSTT